MLHLYILYHQPKPPMPGMGYSLLSWPNGPHGNCRISPAIVKAICYSLQHDYKILFLEAILINAIENGVELVSNQKLYTYWKLLCTLPEEEGNDQYLPAIVTMAYNNDLPQDILLVQCQHKYYGSNPPLSDWIYDTLHEMKPIPDTVKVTKNLRLDRPQT